MSGIDQFLAEHYGTLDVAPSTEDVEKVAQAEMFLKLAAQHNVDINQLSDAQINQLWNQVWSEKTAEEAAKEEHEKAKEEKAKEEHEKAKDEVKEGQAKFAEADYMGRIMAHSYVNQLREYAAAGELDFMKEAADEAGLLTRAGRAIASAAKGEKLREFVHARRAVPEGARKVSIDVARKGSLKHGLKGLAETGGLYGGGAAALGGAAYGAHKALKKDKEEGESKESSVLDQYAAQYAIEKAASYGFDPEEAVQRISAVLTLGPDPSDKIAYVEGLDNAVDVRSSELLELAGYPIDWTGTPFEKQAAEEVGRARRAARAVGEHFSEGGHAVKKVVKGLYNAAKTHGGARTMSLRSAKEHAGKAAILAGEVGGGAAALGGGGYLAAKKLRKKDDEESKESSVHFDVAAAELAIEKAAEAGWDPNQAIERLNSLFNLGYEGDPEASEKVAYAQTGEQALNLRACELLELAGYTINW